MISTHKYRKYTISEYNPVLKDIFDEEAKKLRDVFIDEVVQIEHIGSTAVPGMSGKSSIDIDLAVKNISLIHNYEDKLKSLGYESLGEFVAKNAYFFAKEKDNTRIVNLHIMETNHPEFIKTLAVRDYLRSHPKEVEDYSNLKRDLFEKYADDYSSYRKEKDKYMEKLMLRAQKFI